MSVHDIIALNLTLGLGFIVLTFIFAAGQRLASTWFAFCAVLALSWWFWAIYIAIHFISKYW